MVDFTQQGRIISVGQSKNTFGVETLQQIIGFNHCLIGSLRQQNACEGQNAAGSFKLPSRFIGEKFTRQMQCEACGSAGMRHITLSS